MTFFFAVPGGGLMIFWGPWLRPKATPRGPKGLQGGFPGRYASGMPGRSKSERAYRSRHGLGDNRTFFNRAARIVPYVDQPP